MTDLTDRMRTCAAHLGTIDALEINEAKYEAILDAAELLIEASNLLDAPALGWSDHQAWREALEIIAGRRQSTDNLKSNQDIATAALAVLGEPMEVIPLSRTSPPSAKPPVTEEEMMERLGRTWGTWVTSGDTLPKANPYRSRHTCPQCDSRANKTVHRRSNHFVLECPVCGHVWERA